ncbi:uncharacterized protein METZ01_LOCUS490026, partial [marine metagenome]
MPNEMLDSQDNVLPHRYPLESQ